MNANVYSVLHHSFHFSDHKSRNNIRMGNNKISLLCQNKATIFYGPIPKPIALRNFYKARYILKFIQSFTIEYP